jgi:predicted AlkP superfamily pyrophosphatase or phosphodiesterase
MTTRNAFRRLSATIAALAALSACPILQAQPKVVLISLDGAKPELIQSFLANGTLSPRTGIGLLMAKGATAAQNITATPSLTAVSHIAIATGSTAVNNDVPANTYHAVAQPIGNTTSGFSAPIGGYQFNPLGPNPSPSAVPLWVSLRNANPPRKVVTATWPGGDGLDVTLFGTGNPAPVVQAAVPTRTVDYTVPFGAFAGIGAEGYVKTGADFVADDGTFTAQLAAAGKLSYSPVRVSGPIGVTLSGPPVSTFFCSPAATSSPCGASSAARTLPFTVKAAAIDTTDDGTTNYDTLVFFNADAPAPQIAPGPFTLPATGPAYAASGGTSAKFFLEGTGNVVGTAFFVSFLAPDLSTVRFARYGLNAIPRNAPVIASINDVHENVGFWAAQPDFRIPERLSPGFLAIPDLELEAIYEDQVRTFVAYQTALGLRAISQNQDADLVMIYIEQPDGSGHQWTLTDKRQPTNYLDNRTVGTAGDPPGAIGQDPAVTTRFATYLKYAYRQANAAVQAIIKAVGVDAQGSPRSNVIVVSDHGMAPFHTAVNLRNVLLEGGMTTNDLSAIRFPTSGPSVNLYVNLSGREPGGTVSAAEYVVLQDRIATILANASDTNAFYNPTARKLFNAVVKRPTSCGQVGFCTNSEIGQDFGDVFAIMEEGYNFDGTQSPLVPRLGDAASATPRYSVPNFYGAHGYASDLPSMSAILFAAGPNIKTGAKVNLVYNIDIAPTILQILGLPPSPTANGTVISGILLP